MNGLIMSKIVGIIILIMGMTYAKTSDQLSLELEQFMTLQPISEQYFEHNAYIGWMGLTYPKDNWLTVYRDIFQENDAILNQRMNDGRLITNYFANPKQVVFPLAKSTTVLNKLLGFDDGFVSLENTLEGQKLLSFRQGPFNHQRYRQTQDFFVCIDYLDSQCLTKMLERRSYIDEIIHDNKVLLARFEEIVKTSDYNYALFHNNFNTSFSTVPSSGMMKVILLYLSDSMLKIVDGHIDEGLNQLVIVRQWVDLMFHEKSKAALLHFFLNISVTQFLDQTVNVLLDAGLLNDVLHDERLAFIVRPYDKNIGKKLNEVVLFEMTQNFKNFAYPYIKTYVSSMPKQTFKEEDEYIILSYLKNFGVILPPALNELYNQRALSAKTANWAQLNTLREVTKSIDQTWFNVVYQVKNTLLSEVDTEEELERLHHSHEHFLQVIKDWHKEYFQRLGVSSKEALYALNMLYPSQDFYNDYYKLLKILSSEDYLEQHLSPMVLQAILKEQVMPKTRAFMASLPNYDDFDNYWMRLYEQQNYHQLVYLKYLIMRDHILAEDLSIFLDSKGDLARNTITKYAYDYDPQTGRLSTPLPSKNKHLPIHIKLLRLYDSNVQFFEVNVPKY